MTVKVSIITPMYNASSFIHKTIESVLSQTFKNWELILIDDNSTDNTLEVVKPFVNEDKRIKLVKHSLNAGAGISRNSGIEQSIGEYIAFLDSDDIWYPNKLGVQLKFMNENNALISHSSYALYSESGEPLNIKTIVPNKVEYSKLLTFNYVGTSTVMYNASVLGKHYMPDIKNRQDWALWLKLTKLSPIYFIETPLTKYTVRKQSISSNKIKLIRYHWMIYYNIERLSFLKSTTYLIYNLYKHLFNSKYKKYIP